MERRSADRIGPSPFDSCPISPRRLEGGPGGASELRRSHRSFVLLACSASGPVSYSFRCHAGSAPNPVDRYRGDHRRVPIAVASNPFDPHLPGRSPILAVADFGTGCIARLRLNVAALYFSKHLPGLSAARLDEIKAKPATRCCGAINVAKMWSMPECRPSPGRFLWERRA